MANTGPYIKGTREFLAINTSVKAFLETPGEYSVHFNSIMLIFNCD